MAEQFADIDTDTLEEFALKLDAGRAGATRAAEDAVEHGLTESTQNNLNECGTYLSSLYESVYHELEGRDDGETAILDSPDA